jgi:hypothetical protein
MYDFEVNRINNASKQGVYVLSKSVMESPELGERERQTKNLKDFYIMKQVGKRTSNKEELAKYRQDQLTLKNQAKEDQYNEKKKLLSKNDKATARMLKQKHADGDTQVV